MEKDLMNHEPFFRLASRLRPRPYGRGRPARFRPALECLEVRSVPTVLTADNIDISVNYTPEAKDWELNLHSDAADTDYDPAKSLLYVGPDSRLVQTNDPRYSFTGAEPGQPLWVLSQTPDLTDPRLSLSFANDGVPGGTFARYFLADPRVNGAGTFIKISLIDVRGPGQFSIWQTRALGNPVVWMATAQTGVRDDAYWLEPSGDSGINVGFTATGLYQVDFRASAYLRLDDSGKVLTRSEVVTYNFGVEDTGGFSPGPGGNAPDVAGAALRALTTPGGLANQPVAQAPRESIPAPVQPPALADAPRPETTTAFPQALASHPGSQDGSADGTGSAFALPFGPADAALAGPPAGMS
jgi:hypothetical protein